MRRCDSLFPGGHGEERSCWLDHGHSGTHEYFPPGFVWSDEEQRPVYVSQRDDGSGSSVGGASSGALPTGATDVPHLARAVELLWEAGHPGVAEALEREVRAVLTGSNQTDGSANEPERPRRLGDTEKGGSA